MHHVAYEVADVRAALDELAEQGVELVDHEPRQGLFGLEVAFVHPDAVHGVLRNWWPMTSHERVVVELAFDGGQIVGARLTSESADELEKALADRKRRALTLDADDGRYTIPLARVVYFKRFRARRGSAFPAVPRRSRLRRTAWASPVDGLGRAHDPVEPASLVTAIRRLVEQAQQGDRDALEELYLLHFDRIYSYLHMRRRQPSRAEDLTTQVFVKMLESIGRFRWRSAPFSAWLFRIAHNLAMDLSGRTGAGSRGGGARTRSGEGKRC